MDQGETQDGGSGFVRSVIKAFTGSRFTTPKESPRASPTHDLLLDAERSGRVNAREVVSDEEVKAEIDVGIDSRSPIASLTSELRQERRLTFRGEIGQSVSRPVSEEINLSERESQLVFGRPGGVPGGNRSRLSSCIDQLDTVGNQNYDTLFDTNPLAEQGVYGGERKLSNLYSEPAPLLSGDRSVDRDLNGEYSRTFPSTFLQRTGELSPAGTTGFREQDFSSRHFTSAPTGSAYKGFNEDLSSRLGRNDGGNVTQRDTKRPKERSKDKAYKSRFSLSSTVGGSAPFVAGFTTGANGQDEARKTESAETPRLSEPPRQSWENGYVPPPSVVSVRVRPGASPSANFEIFLTHSGDTVIHRVWNEMPISQLMSEAGSIFGLDPTEMLLVLFSSQPVSLQRGGSIMGPPRVTPGSNVMVFYVHSSGCTNVPYAPPTRTASHGHGFQPPYHPDLPVMNTKLLATFKLPKFDGVARTWKAWEKSFQRFLGIHGLDHVLEEDFLNILWVVPGAKAANKMVYYLIEDAVATGTLASKLVRQATKWHGHEAFTMLRNGYVFNGPQTATILLAELSNMRLLRDEDASTFCLRLVELIEDLELIPGDAAVHLTDIQKLGYLLSAIRHEKSLQAVYSQLQSEQLRGIVSFDQACRELHHRVEAMRADDFLDSRPGRALVSTEIKRHGQLAGAVQKVACLAKDCAELVPPYLALCKLCYLQCMAGKTPTLALRDSLGTATFNSQTKKLDFPATVPKSRFPQKGLKKGKKVLMAGVSGSTSDSASTDTQL
jgi:hypothetical protein